MRRKLQWGMVLFTMVAVAGVASAQPGVAPSPEMAKLSKKLVGTWDAVVKTGPTESKAVSKYREDMGGMWLVSEFEGEFAGAPFKGMGVDGYDPAKKKYVSVWFDSMTSKPMLTEGELDATGKKLTLKGNGPGPDGADMQMKMVTEFVDDNHMTFTMYTVGPDGSDAEMMSIAYTRRKG